MLDQLIPALSTREAQPRDASAIAAVLRAAFAQYKCRYTLAAFAATTPSGEEIARRLGEGPIWVVLLRDTVVGTASILPRGEALYLRSMAVVPRVRGQGAGRLLLSQVECYAIMNGYERIELSTTPFLTDAIRLYERAGFYRTEGGVADLLGTPLITMTKALSPAFRPETRATFAHPLASSLQVACAAQAPVVPPGSSDEWRRGPFVISTDRARLDLPLIHTFLASSYWANAIPLAIVERSIAHSLPFGVYEGRRQVGFARVITDYATFAYVADVFVIPEYRARKLGQWLMAVISAHPHLQRLRRWVLATRDAHGLYKKVGFAPLENPSFFMERFTPNAYGDGSVDDQEGTRERARHP
jgi:GNAT superfamily N-acetyltransferase